MASIPMYDPLSTQARSSWLAGLTEACNKISNILNMSTSDFVDLELPELYISPLDRYRIYQAPLGNKLWLTTPKPVVKKNGVVITESADGFNIDYLGGSIIFDEGYTLTADDVVTVSATYISNESSELKEILRNIDDISEKADTNKGYYSTLAELNAEVPEGKAGDYAFVADSNSLYMWDDTAGKWTDTYKPVDLSGYDTSEAVDAELAKKENVIQPYGDTTASDTYYWGGRKTWQALEPRVRDTKLTGLDTSGTAEDKITANDSVLSALGKLQAQANDNIHPQQGTGAPTESTVGRIGEDYVNTSNGDIYHLTATDNGKYIWEQYANVSDVDALKEYVDNKKVEVDAVPTDGSDNAVSSDGVYGALQGKQDKSTGSAGQIAGYNTEGNLSPIEGAYFSYTAGNNTLNIDIEGNLNVDGESDLQGLVPNTRTINGYPLSQDITLTASDIEGLSGGGAGKRTCRFVVGTSTAGWTEADCDYLCDGEADDVEINAAITALPSVGGEIVVLSGIYNITATIRLRDKPIYIRGNGRSTVLKRKFTETKINGRGVISSYSYSNSYYPIEISHLTIDGNKEEYPVSTGEGIIYNYGIWLYNQDDDSIDNSVGSGYGNGSVIHDIKCYDCDAGIVNASGSDSILANNYVHGCYIGIYVMSSKCVSVLNNKVYDNHFGIYATTTPNSPEVGRNQITNNSSYGDKIGIKIPNGHNFVITDNVIGAPNKRDYTAIDTDVGIEIGAENNMSSGGAVYNSIISNNLVERAYKGIACYHTEESVISSNMLTAAYIGSSYTSQFDTLILDINCSNNLVADNMLYYNYVDQSSSKNNTFVNNKVLYTK